MTRVFQIVLLPLLVVALPLIYLAAWMGEALSDLSLRSVPAQRLAVIPARHQNAR